MWYAKGDGNEIEHVFYGRDAADNPLYRHTKDGCAAYTYDSLNQLRSERLPAGTLTTWTYDAARRRVGQFAAGGLTTWLYDAADQLLTAGAVPG